MMNGIDLFIALFNNLAIFIGLVATYSYLFGRFRQSNRYRRQIILGISFGLFAVGCMYARIPVYEGVIVDQRNAVIALSGAFGGPISAIISAVFAGAYRAYLGGDGVVAGEIGVSLAALAGIVLNIFSMHFNSIRQAAINALIAVIIILPGFLFVGDIQTGWELMKAVALPYGAAIFLGIFLGGLLLHREEERYEVEVLLRESENKYRELVEETNDLITQIDKHGNFTFVNHVAEKIFGIPREECIGMASDQFIHPDDRDAVVEWFYHCVAQKIKQTKLENRLVNTKTGKSHSVQWSSTFYFDDAGNFEGVGSIARDITDIREAEANYKNLFEKMPNGYAVHEVIRDADGQPLDYRFISINPALERIAGLKAEAFIGKTVLEALPDTKEYWFDIYSEITSTGEPVTFENYFDELDRYFEVTVYSLAENQFASIFQDVTLRKKAEAEKASFEAQLRQRQKMESIGTLSGGIAHDFNNILVPIIGYVESGMMNLSPEEKLYTDLKRVRQAAGRAADLTRQILAFSRKQVLEMRTVDLNTIVLDFNDMIQRLLREDIELHTFLESALYQINADKGQIEQVLMNLVVNARDAMPTGGKLTIETANVYLDEAYVKKYVDIQSPGQYVMLAVSDTGFGMDPETRQQIFEPFFTTKERGEGTGLGLSTVFGIIKQHGGHIWVYSEPDRGTTFKIYLPQAKDTAQIPEMTTAELDSVYGTETILVVEDEEMVRQLICETLTAYGYDVLEAQSPKDGLRLAAQNKETLCLLLTDVIMPEMNGKDLYQKLSAIQPDTKVLYMSGYTDNVIVHHGILDGGVNFLQKPFTVQSLTQKVRQVLN